ncbi:hypothetical protein [Streptomyces agglomeratus]|uniref:hypothetical protein n=1 Tax=Streptomyces agglomeratus TaxID=285458 RepID=UPI00114CC0FC|nr:hypothetical protein [Streptomyces agglomeratus]
MDSSARASGWRMSGVAEEARGRMDAFQAGVSEAVAANVAEARIIAQGGAQDGHAVNLPEFL